MDRILDFDEIQVKKFNRTYEKCVNKFSDGVIKMLMTFYTVLIVLDWSVYHGK